MAVTLLLANCAAPPVTVNLDSSNHQRSLQQQTDWLINGRIGFKGSDKKQSAYFRWQQDYQAYQLNLTSIIGTSILKMTGDAQLVTLEADDESYQDNNPNQLIKRITGWDVPVQNLQYWVKGQHGPKDIVTLSEQGWLTQLIPVCDFCKSWVIHYGNYKRVKQVWLPHKITLKNQTNNSQLLIKVNTWVLN